MLAKNQYGNKVSHGYIIHGKSRHFIFQPEKLSKHLSIFDNTFYCHTYMLNFVIFFLKFLSHTFQYSKILKSPLAYCDDVILDKAYMTTCISKDIHNMIT